MTEDNDAKFLATIGFACLFLCAFCVTAIVTLPAPKTHEIAFAGFVYVMTVVTMVASAKFFAKAYRAWRANR